MPIPVATVRRSPLESAHVGPASRPEGAADAPPVTLAEAGPYDKFLLLGPTAALAASGLLGREPSALTVEIGTVSGRTVEVWPLGPGETLLIFEASEGAATQVAGTMPESDVSVIDVGSAWTVLSLSGPAAPAVLAELITVDVDPRSLAAGSLVQGPLAGVRAIVARRDAATEPGYAILVARDYALYCWDTLVEIGAAHGLAIGVTHGRVTGTSETTR